VPLHVTININRHTIETLHIGRLSGGTKPNDMNTYAAVLGERPYWVEDWERGVQYEHRYGDGALVCVKKALEALEKQNELPQLKIDLDKATHRCDFDFQIWKETAVCKCGAIANNPLYIGTRQYETGLS
jgi:hypothetical protein